MKVSSLCIWLLSEGVSMLKSSTVSSSLSRDIIKIGLKILLPSHFNSLYTFTFSYHLTFNTASLYNRPTKIDPSVL